MKNKTFKQYLEQLGVLKQFKDNVVSGNLGVSFKTFVHSEGETSPLASLGRGFRWSDTPEGEDFWSEKFIALHTILEEEKSNG